MTALAGILTMTNNRPNIFIAGHNGMVGSSILRMLSADDVNIITASKDELDLTNQAAVNSFFASNKIDQVYLSAAKVGGINANNIYPADFIYINIMIQTNVINAAYNSGIKKLLFLGSSCIYPKTNNQPIKESSLLSGKLEETNEPYAIAKIAGIKLCESFNRQHKDKGIDFRSIMPTNLYGPGDNYNLENSHVIPALIRKFHEAKINKSDHLEVWGTGNPKREFLHVNDMARACIHVMNIDKKSYDKLISPMSSHINVGSGEDISIKNLSYLIKDIIDYSGKIVFDDSKPDGTIRKLLDISLIKQTGWLPEIGIKEGLNETYKNFLENYSLRYRK